MGQTGPDPHLLRELVLARIRSADYLVIPWIGEQSRGLSDALLVELQTPAELLAGPWPGATGVSFFRKTDLLPLVLARARQARGIVLDGGVLHTEDVLLVFDPGDEEGCARRVALWADWLDPDRADR